MKGLPGGMQQFLRQANQLQTRMQKLQAELEEREYTASSGGGAVQIKVNGKYQIVNLTISPEVMKSQDAEMLQDLIMTATNEALKTVRETSQKEIGELTGGMAMPGLF